MEAQDIVTHNGITIEVESCHLCYALVASSDVTRHLRWHGKCVVCNDGRDALAGTLYCPEHTGDDYLE